MLGRGDGLGIASALVYSQFLLGQIILDGFDHSWPGSAAFTQAGTLFMHLVDLHAAVVDDRGTDQQFIDCRLRYRPAPAANRSADPPSSSFNAFAMASSIFMLSSILHLLWYLPERCPSPEAHHGSHQLLQNSLLFLRPDAPAISSSISASSSSAFFSVINTKNIAQSCDHSLQSILHMPWCSPRLHWCWQILPDQI